MYQFMIQNFWWGNLLIIFTLKHDHNWMGCWDDWKQTVALSSCHNSAITSDADFFCTLLLFHNCLICRLLWPHRFLVTICLFLYPWSGLNPPLSHHPHRSLNFQAIAEFRELQREMMRESDAFSGNLWANKSSQPGDAPCLPLLFYPPNIFLFLSSLSQYKSRTNWVNLIFIWGEGGGGWGNIRNPLLRLIYFHNKMYLPHGLTNNTTTSW